MKVDLLHSYNEKIRWPEVASVEYLLPSVSSIM